MNKKMTMTIEIATASAVDDGDDAGDDDYGGGGGGGGGGNVDGDLGGDGDAPSSTCREKRSACLGAIPRSCNKSETPRPWSSIP